jgi:RND family efflux transporter MFP subunit
MTRHAVIVVLLAYISIFGWKPSFSFAQQQVSISGITEPIKDRTLSATVADRISAIFFKEGGITEQGHTILELDNSLEVLEVKRRKLIWESKAELESVDAQVTTLKSLLQSTRELFTSTHSVSREELEKLELEYKVAVAEKHRLEAAEEREKIEYEMALQNLEKRRLKSPISGTIIKLFLDEGETCEENQPLVRVVDTSRGIFVCNVEEWIGRTLKNAQSVDLKIRTGSKSIRKKGTIIFVSPVVDPASGLLEVKAEFNNSDGSVRPGVAGSMLLRIH